MSAHMRKHHTSQTTTSNKNNILYVMNNDMMYAIPKKVAEKYVVEVATAMLKPDRVSTDDIFKELNQHYTKAGALLQGVRARENLSQVAFAKKIKVTQANLSKMENGKRPIGKIIAKRIEKALRVDYSYFLE